MRHSPMTSNVEGEPVDAGFRCRWTSMLKARSKSPATGGCISGVSVDLEYGMVTFDGHVPYIRTLP
jgi:hypothetical protein